MKIKVESCWGGKEVYFRITMPDGSREIVTGSKWTKKVATEALNIAENLYGINRRNVKFVHK